MLKVKIKYQKQRTGVPYFIKLLAKGYKKH